MKSTKPDLIIEPHPQSYEGYPFITLVKFQYDYVLCIVDNVDDKTLKAYVLDECAAVNLNEKAIIQVAEQWYNDKSDRYPLSIEFSHRGLSPHVSEIFKEFDLNHITRIVGPVPRYEMKEIKNVRRRKKRKIDHATIDH